MPLEQKVSRLYRPFEVKAVDSEARTFAGLASTWELDSDGELIDPGAFGKTLGDWRASKGRRIIPLIDQHNYRSVRAVFGKVETATETDSGLETKFSIVASPEGEEYMSRIAGGYLNGLSIGFQTIRAEPDEMDIGGTKIPVRRIKEVRLMEISAVIWGANPSALIDMAAVKALLREVGQHELAADDEQALKALRGEIDSLLSTSGIRAETPEAEAMRVRLQKLNARQRIAL